MHIKDILQQKIQSVYPIHKVRLNCLLNFGISLAKHKRLTVTNLGRDLENKKYSTKTAIRTADKLIGNKKLHMDRLFIYQALATYLIKNNVEPIILVDWSDLNDMHDIWFLRATLATGGQGLTIYEKVYHISDYNNQKIHENFLDELELVLGEHVKPIIITDAGFKDSWFQAVEEKGWNYVGRVRGKTSYSEDAGASWHCIRDLYANAKKKATYVGEVLLAKRKQRRTHMILSKQSEKKSPDMKKTKGIRSGQAPKRYKQSYEEPWLLVTSLEIAKDKPSKIIALYKKRMQIEGSFRYLKSQYGLRNSESQTRIRYRYSNLLLVALISQIITWLCGRIGEEKGLEKKYQANTIRKRKVLSTLFLGNALLKKQELNLSKIPINRLFGDITNLNWDLNYV
jgi:DDE family transposase